MNKWIGNKRITKYALVVPGAIFICGLVIAIRADNWANWTGFGKGESISVSTVLKQDADGRPVETKTSTIEPGKNLWDWLSLLGVPLTLAILGYVFQQQERNRAEIALREQREIAADEAAEEILQAYFDRLSSLLIDKNILAIATCPKESLTSEQSALLNASISVIRARTSSILRRFEGNSGKIKSVFIFLKDFEASSEVQLQINEVNLSEIDFRDADLRGINFKKSNFERANLSGTDLRDANLSEANFKGANLSGADLGDANLSEANFKGANLSGADLKFANLSFADFEGADLSGADLSFADLSSAKLRDVRSSRTSFFAADLSVADLSSANLSETYFFWANLSSANLSSADLSGAYLSGVNFTEANFSKLKSDDKTKWPDPTTVVKAKNIPEALKQQLGIKDSMKPETPDF